MSMVVSINVQNVIHFVFLFFVGGALFNPGGEALLFLFPTKIIPEPFWFVLAEGET